jgi:dihydrofolate synthase/folylpolyglutamate synthase
MKTGAAKVTTTDKCLIDGAVSLWGFTFCFTLHDWNELAQLGVARARPLLETISRYAAEIHLVMPQQSRASSFEELEALIPENFTGKVRRTTVAGVFPAAGVCTVGGLTDTVVVTGSIYLLGEVLARIEPERGAIENRLQDF